MSKFYLALIIVLIAVKSEAVLLCSQVLLPTRQISLAESDAAINDVAKLTMELDLARINGIDNPVIASMRTNFPAKMAELNSKLIGVYSEAQIKKLVAAKVRELQNNDRIEAQRETSERKREQEQGYGFLKMQDQIALDDVRGHYLEYLPTVDSVMFRTARKEELIKMDLKSRAKKVLQKENAASVFLPNRNEIIAIDREGKILRYDLNTGKKHQVIKTKLKDLRYKIAVSPNEDRIIVRNEYQVVVIFLDRIQNGIAEIKQATVIPRNEDVDYEFVSQNEILLADGRLTLLDLNTMQSTRVNTAGTGFRVHMLTISPDRKLLYWKGDQNEPRGIIPLADFRNFEKASKVLPTNAAAVKFGNTENEFYMDLQVTRGLYKYPEVETAIQFLPRDLSWDQHGYGELPAFGNSEKMFTRQTFIDGFNRREGTILEIWERE